MTLNITRKKKAKVFPQNNESLAYATNYQMKSTEWEMFQVK